MLLLLGQTGTPQCGSQITVLFKLPKHFVLSFKLQLYSASFQLRKQHGCLVCQPAGSDAVVQLSVA